MMGVNKMESSNDHGGVKDRNQRLATSLNDPAHTSAVEQIVAEMKEAERLVELAQRIATDAHRGQVDKAGNPYIGHPERVVGAVDEHYAAAAAWLHDVAEDTPVSIESLRQMFPAIVIDAVEALTRQTDELPSAYYARVRANPIALEVKLADIADNCDPTRLAMLDVATQVRLREKYQSALAQLTGEGGGGHCEETD